MATPPVDLVWPGKYDHEGRRSRPAPVASTSALVASLERSPGDLRAEDSWVNRLYHGDNEQVLGMLLPELAGKVDLIYIDPPFGTGSRFWTTARGSMDAPEALAYDDSWRGGIPEYLSFLDSRLQLAIELLSSTGSLLLHCDHRVSHYVGCLLDELLGPGDRGTQAGRPGFRSEIIWTYGLGGSSARCYPKKHDTILWYSKGSSWVFSPPLVAATSQRMKGQQKKCPDTWDIPSLNNMATERTGYPTQKPEALLERIVLAHSLPGQLVLDFFSGSGTTLVQAARAGRRWLGCDSSALAIEHTWNRLKKLELGGQLDRKAELHQVRAEEACRAGTSDAVVGK